MWEYEYSTTTYATKEQIWKVLTDINNWRQWNREIEWSQCHDTFEKNAKIILKLKGRPITTAVINDYQSLYNFSNIVNVFFAKITSSYFIEEKVNSTKITHKISISGPFTFLFCRLMGGKIKDEMPSVMRSLIIVASSQFA